MVSYLSHWIWTANNYPNATWQCVKPWCEITHFIEEEERERDKIYFILHSLTCSMCVAVCVCLISASIEAYVIKNDRCFSGSTRSMFLFLIAKFEVDHKELNSLA